MGADPCYPCFLAADNMNDVIIYSRGPLMKRSLSDKSLTEVTARLSSANEEFTHHYPGETGRRQPVHTVYGGAHLFKSDTAKRLGVLAQRSLDQFAPDFLTFARAIGLPGAVDLRETTDEAEDLGRKE